MGLLNPYSHLDEDALCRVQANISMADKKFLSSILPVHGILQTTVNILIHDIITELRATGITSYNPSNLEAYVAIIRRRTFAGAPGQTHGGNDAGRTSGVHDSNALPTSVPASPVLSPDSGPQQRKDGTKKQKAGRANGRTTGK